MRKKRRRVSSARPLRAVRKKPLQRAAVGKSAKSAKRVQGANSRKRRLARALQRQRKQRNDSPASARTSRRRLGTAADRSSHAAGFADGTSWRNAEPEGPVSPARVKEALQHRWRMRNEGAKTADWGHLLRRGISYAEGFMQAVDCRFPMIPVPLRRSAAAVVCADYAEPALPAVLKQLDCLPLQEIIIVLHHAKAGATPPERKRIHDTALIVHLPDTADANIGRALGAKLAESETMMFVSGEKVVDGAILARFLLACDGGADVALNDLTARRILFNRRSGLRHLHEFLNATLHRPDLKYNSLSALPFALTRRAMASIGAANLAVPAKAHAMAIMNKLRFAEGGTAAVPEPPFSEGKWKQAAGDHAEAWQAAMSVRGGRLKHADTMRNRSILGDWER